jgi:hypothetical protein
MEFPDAATVDAVLPDPTLPAFHEVHYDPPAPTLDDVTEATRTAVDALSFSELPSGATVAVGLGSRGITDIVPVARAVVDELCDCGLDPVVVPAMGSHGGATAEGQRRTLASLGLTEEALGCPVDARMDAERIGESTLGSAVYFSRAALDADGVVVVNRVKAHTNFDGPFESGLCKMATVGLGKQVGASAIHERATVDGFVPTIEAALDVVRAETPFLGGIAIVENFLDETADVQGVPAAALPDGEFGLLERAYDHMPTLPYDEIDVLVVDRIGKDVSGAGMDTNVIGRYDLRGVADPETPDIERIVVRGLTETTHGNGHGIGLADLTTRAVADELDLEQMYANALTSGSHSKSHLPVVLPTDRHALVAAVSAIGPYDPDTVRIAWIEDTGHLASFHVSPALARETVEHVTVGEPRRLVFGDEDVRFEPTE